ncbi:MAG: hypothetical protein H0W22_05605, partial [Chloroflexi bacterium]|nr:hypothetical protein [Chloroflexota bacterium]
VMAGVVVGVRWPGASRAVAVGIGAVLGNLAGWAITNWRDPRPDGENMWFWTFVFMSIPIAAHTVGTVVRDRIRFRRAARA